ncbi:L-tyrosine 3-hydroxylase [Saccharothrix sp. Mg75]|uniref:L-tyrosine 3-hydroxylase n=1 Tax=Saccharothrix sp. Mg75 TaxID=3445357 RepID=UPI003EE94022
MTAVVDAPGPAAESTDLPALRLPAPDAALADCVPPCRRPPALRLPDALSDADSLGWYRWVLGHHVAVCVWRLLGDRLSDALRPDAPEEAGDAVAGLYDAYSALLLYSGSCSPETYATVIRARMKARHPAFSGTWARDYEHVSDLLGRFKPVAGDRVKRALRTNRLVHMTVAKRLVPRGKSLLRESGMDPTRVTDADRDRFDDFFGIARAGVCRAEFDDQLADRVALVVEDLAARPDTAHYDNDDVSRLQAGLPEHLEQLVAHPRRKVAP